MKQSEQIDLVVAALFQVHAALENPRKDAKGQVPGQKDYAYLSLPALIDHLRPPMKDAGIFATQEVLGGQGFTEVTTTIWHQSGQWLQFGPAFMPAGGAEQQIGSAQTYDRRYALAAIFNLAADKDDDAASSGRRVPESSPSRPAASTSVPLEGAAPADPASARGEAAEVGSPRDRKLIELLARGAGKTREAVDLVNVRNGTSYGSWRQVKEEATEAEIEKGLS